MYSQAYPQPAKKQLDLKKALVALITSVLIPLFAPYFDEFQEKANYSLITFNSNIEPHLPKLWALSYALMSIILLLLFGHILFKFYNAGWIKNIKNIVALIFVVFYLIILLVFASLLMLKFIFYVQ